MDFCGDAAGAVIAEPEPSPGESLTVCFVCHWLIIELRKCCSCTCLDQE